MMTTMIGDSQLRYLEQPPTNSPSDATVASFPSSIVIVSVVALEEDKRVLYTEVLESEANLTTCYEFVSSEAFAYRLWLLDEWFSNDILLVEVLSF